MHPQNITLTPSLVARFWAKVHIPDDPDACWLWSGGRDASGYGHLWVGPGRGKPIYAHRVSWVIHYGPIPDGCHVCHHCDNPPCVKPVDLFVGTHADNMQDSLQKGRFVSNWPIPRGEKNGHAVLTESQVLAIRAEFQPGVLTATALAKKYGVARPTINHILKRESWKYI